MSKLLTACLLTGTTAGLAACSPPYNPEDKVEWYIANHTADTLLLRIRYRLDSVKVALADLPRLRQTQTADSLGQLNGLFSLDHLAWHRGRWYWVRNAYVTAFPFWSDAVGRLHAAATNRTAGIVTYKLMPGGKHYLTGQYCLPCDTLPPTLSPLVSLRLRQGQAQRDLPTGTKLNQLFLVQPHFWRAWLDWGKPTTYRYELSVGTGLAFNDD
ncbi:MAG: hypothetical protein ACRYFX_04340 [Janthinobacterium lividum]